MDWPMDPLWSMSRMTCHRFTRLARSKNHTRSGRIAPNYLL